MNQVRITQRVWEGAIGQIRAGVIQGSQEEAAERVGRAEAEQNARLAANLIGHDTFAVRNLAITGFDLRSRPEYALIGGNVQWRGAAEQVGAHLRIIAEQQAALNASQAQERRATEAMDRRVQQLENRQEALAHSRLVRLLRYLRLL